MKRIKIYLTIMFFTLLSANVSAQYIEPIYVDRIWYKILKEASDDMPGEVEVTNNHSDSQLEFSVNYIPDEINYNGKIYHVVSFGDVYRTDLDVLRLGKYIRSIHNGYYFHNQYFDISEENETFKSLHGIVFSKNGKELLICPKEYNVWYEYPSPDIKNWTIPNSVEVIGEYAFYDCVPSLYNKIEFYASFPPELKIIGNQAFASSDPFYARAIDKFGTDVIAFPQKLEHIGYYAFNCLSLKEVEFNEGLTQIGEAAFSANKLEKVTLPSTLKKLGRHAFGSNPITTITCLAPEPPEITANEPTDNSRLMITCNEQNQILVVPVGTVDLYSKAPGWEKFGKIVELGTDAINDVTGSSSSLSTNYKNGVMTIKGVNRGERISIYSSVGILIKSIKAEADTAVVNLPQSNQIIMIKAGSHILKIKI